MLSRAVLEQNIFPKNQKKLPAAQIPFELRVFFDFKIVCAENLTLSLKREKQYEKKRKRREKERKRGGRKLFERSARASRPSAKRDGRASG